MYKSKYNIILTILIIVAVIAIIIIGTVAGIKIYKKQDVETGSAQVIAQFDTDVPDVNTNGTTDSNLSLNINAMPTQETSGSSGRKVQYYKEYIMLGYITISKTNVKYPIVADVSVGALEIAVGVIYPSNPSLNTPGNVVIIGHNYRNSQFFSNNKKLELGDTIKIKDSSGITLTYTIYEIFETSANDVSFYNRNTNGATEITLSTCTDDGNNRLIIKAKA